MHSGGTEGAQHEVRQPLANEPVQQKAEPHHTPDPPKPPSECKHSTWVSVPLNKVGSSNLQLAGTIGFAIPTIVPGNASDVLFYVYVEAGYSDMEVHENLKLYTANDNRQFEKYLRITGYPKQVAFNTNSENMWFPMPDNRLVYLQVPKIQGVTVILELFLIGYRNCTV